MTTAWIRLCDLRRGAIFETQEGVRAVKTEYYYPNDNIECVLLASGEYAHFGADHNRTLVREIVLDEVAR